VIAVRVFAVFICRGFTLIGVTASKPAVGSYQSLRAGIASIAALVYIRTNNCQAVTQSLKNV
jgi:hypothetical protein